MTVNQRVQTVAAMVGSLASEFPVRGCREGFKINLSVCGTQASTAAATSVRPAPVWALRSAVLTPRTAFFPVPLLPGLPHAGSGAPLFALADLVKLQFFKSR